MNDERERPAGREARPTVDPRQERLKRALRENLKRRKAQARGRDAAPVDAGDGEPDDG